MSKAACILALVALCGTVAHAVSSCSSTECTASASISLIQFGPGSCSASAVSYCGAFASSKSCFKSVVVNEVIPCRDAQFVEDVKCAATAVALAITSAYAAVECNADFAYGCASAESAAEAAACAFAGVLLDLNVDIENTDSGCDAGLGVFVNAIAEAQAEANALACGVGPFFSDFDIDFQFGLAIQTAIAKAYAECLIYCDDNDVLVVLNAYTKGKTVDFELSTPGAITCVGGDGSC